MFIWPGEILDGVVHAYQEVNANVEASTYSMIHGFIFLDRSHRTYVRTMASVQEDETMNHAIRTCFHVGVHLLICVDHAVKNLPGPNEHQTGKSAGHGKTQQNQIMH